MPLGWLQQLERLLSTRPGALPPFPPLPPKPSSPETDQLLPPPPPAKPSLPDSIRLVYRRNPRARRYVIRVTEDGTIYVTIPRGGTDTFAQRFLIEKEAWIRAQLERLAHTASQRPSWAPGSQIWFRGERHPLVVFPDHARLAEVTFPLPSPEEDWRTAVSRHLHALAAQELPPLVRDAAQRHGITVRRVQVRNQRSRWGSCSANGTISLNWRLIQLPLSVRDYLVAHELAHRVQMNHSRRFWAVVESFHPAWRDAEQWLRKHGRHVLL